MVSSWTDDVIHAAPVCGSSFNQVRKKHSHTQNQHPIGVFVLFYSWSLYISNYLHHTIHNRAPIKDIIAVRVSCNAHSSDPTVAYCSLSIKVDENNYLQSTAKSFWGKLECESEWTVREWCVWKDIWRSRPLTWEDEEDSRDEGQDGALGPNVSDVADDKRGEDEEQGHHGEGRGRPHHFWEWGEGGREGGGGARGKHWLWELVGTVLLLWSLHITQYGITQYPETHY